MDMEYDYVAWDVNNCPVGGVTSTLTSIQIVLDPNPVQFPGMGGSMMISGTLGVGGGTVLHYPDAADPVLSFPCQTIQAAQQGVLMAAVLYSPGVHYPQATITRCDGRLVDRGR